jgi:uncharacterized protein (TIGR03083 family)
VSERLNALQESVAHLYDVASGIEPIDYTSPAYPSEWTVADTMSHLGSGAVIGARGIEDFIAERERDTDFNQTVWNLWNAKAPADQVSDALVSDREYLEALRAMTDEQRAGYQMSLGPMSFDFDGVVGLRLGEHAVHTWDIEVSFDADATLSSGASGLILDRIGFLLEHTARAPGDGREITIHTIDPDRSFTLRLTDDSAELVEEPHDGRADLEIPAEALVRLFYGRLDEAHTPDSLHGDEVVAYLRGVFRGF